MPRFLSPEEADELGPRPLGKKHFVAAAIEALQEGQMMHITRQEFRWKRCTPRKVIYRIECKSNKKFELCGTRDKLGWIVKRTK